MEDRSVKQEENMEEEFVDPAGEVGDEFADPEGEDFVAQAETGEVAITETGWKPWKAFLLEGIVVVLLFTAGGFMQSKWGMKGLAMTEAMLLVLAVGVACFHRTPIREVFPIKIPKLRECAGVIVLLPAGMMCSMISIGVTMLVFPKMLDEMTGISSFLYSGENFGVLVLIAAVLPAICEEAIHRGAILSHLRPLKRDWLIILIMGLFFGLFHLSIARFLSTALLGMLLTWLVVKKNNLTLAMLLHFLNNLVSVTVGFFGGKAANGASMDMVRAVPPLRMLGSYCILGCLMPVLLAWGVGLMEGRCKEKKRWILSGIVSAALLAAGIACIACSL